MATVHIAPNNSAAGCLDAGLGERKQDAIVLTLRDDLPVGPLRTRASEPGRRADRGFWSEFERAGRRQRTIFRRYVSAGRPGSEARKRGLSGARCSGVRTRRRRLAVRA
ncbi:hypothetical protein C5O80_30365 [Burkholderia sp. SRS-46]|nr:hypothetical protein C5O80_30365 [Burkholderia sp. SRS-46]